MEDEMTQLLGQFIGGRAEDQDEDTLAEFINPENKQASFRRTVGEEMEKAAKLSLLNKGEGDESLEALQRLQARFPQYHVSDLEEEFRTGTRETAKQFSRQQKLEFEKSQPEFTAANTTRYVLDRIPFVGIGSKIGTSLARYRAGQRIEAGEGTEEDEWMMAEAAAQAEREKGHSIGRGVVDMATALPAVITEFVATGGTGAGGRALTTQATTRALARVGAGQAAPRVGQLTAQRIVGEAVKRGAIGATKRAAGLAGEVAGRTVSPVGLAQIAGGAVERIAPEVGTEGGQVVVGPTGDIEQSVRKSAVAKVVENVFFSGGHAPGVGKAAAGGIGPRIVQAAVDTPKVIATLQANAEAQYQTGGSPQGTFLRRLGTPEGSKEALTEFFTIALVEGAKQSRAGLRRQGLNPDSPKNQQKVLDDALKAQAEAMEKFASAPDAELAEYRARLEKASKDYGGQLREAVGQKPPEGGQYPGRGPREGPAAPEKVPAQRPTEGEIAPPAAQAEAAAPPEAATAPKEAPPEAGIEATPEKGELLHILSYKSPKESVNDAVRVLEGSSMRPIDTWADTKDQKATARERWGSNAAEGTATLVFDRGAMEKAGATIEERQGIAKAYNKNAPKFDPSLKQVMFKGKAEGPEFNRLREAVEALNEKRASFELPPVELVATEGSRSQKTTIGSPAPTLREKMAAKQQPGAPRQGNVPKYTTAEQAALAKPVSPLAGLRDIELPSGDPVLTHLTELPIKARDRDLFMARLREGVTLEAAGLKHGGVSRQRAKQIEDAVLAKLKEADPKTWGEFPSVAEFLKLDAADRAAELSKVMKSYENVTGEGRQKSGVPTMADPKAEEGLRQVEEADEASVEAARELAGANRPRPQPMPMRGRDPSQFENAPDAPSVLYAGLPVPPGVHRALAGLNKLIFGRGRGADPATFAPDTDPNPDNPRRMMDWDTAKQAASNQMGARNVNDFEVATTGWAYLKHQAKQLRNAWEISHANKPDPFAAGPDGKVELANGQRGFRSDVIEAELRNPGSQQLTPDQLLGVALWKGVWEKQLKAMEAAGVKKFYDAAGNERTVADLLKEGYFHRAVADDPAGAGFFEAVRGLIGGKPGAKPRYRMHRSYETEAEGHAGGVQYKRSFYESIGDYIEATNREIADHKLANDPLLQGTKKPIADKIAAEMKKAQPILATLSPAERSALKRQILMLATQSATGNVAVAPAFRGKSYPEEVKRHLEQMYGEGGSYLKAGAAVMQEFRNLVLGPDFSYATLQLQSMLFSNPIRWAKTIARIPGEFLRGGTIERLAAQKPEVGQAIKEIVESGGSIGTRPEQISTLQPGKSVVGRVPLLGPALERFGRAFGTTMDLAKIELWNANKPENKAEWPRMMESIEQSLGQGRMEQLGMTPERAFLERVFFLAPSYYRAHVKLMEQAMTQRGAPGFYARKQLGSLATGVLLTSLAGLYALRATGQIDQEELEERLNPSRGKFLMLPIPIGADKTAEVGLGGFYLSILRTIGNAKRWQEEGFESAKDPFIRWYRGHSGIGVRTSWDVATGEDFMGKPVSKAEVALRTVTPLAAQQVALGEGTPKEKAVGAAVGATGLRSWPGKTEGEAAVSSIYELKSSYLRKTGRPEQAAARTKSVIAPLKEAARDGDQAAFDKAKAEYLENHKKAGKSMKAAMESLGDSLARLDPLSSLSKADRAKLWGQMSEPQKERYKKAHDYSVGLRKKIAEMWKGPAKAQ